MAGQRDFEHSEHLLTFTTVNEALRNIGLDQKERMRIYKILSAILYLGNVNFEENSATENLEISHDTIKHLQLASQLLKVESHVLETSLLTRDIDVRGSDPVT